MTTVVTVTEDPRKADWLKRSQQGQQILHVRNKHAEVALLHDAVKPDGTGTAIRDKLGRVVLVGPTGAFLGYAEWFGASAWASTDYGRGRIAHRNPHGAWVWH
jgi:hypothetical protein